jgi:hypothetical protein
MSERKKRHEDLARLAKEAFGQHVIAREDSGRWLLKQPNNGSHFWTEIICVEGRGLYIDGDIEPVVMRYGPTDFEARVRWMASRKDGGDSYFVEKASIGMGGRGVDVEMWESQIARDDLRDFLVDNEYAVFESDGGWKHHPDHPRFDIDALYDLTRLLRHDEASQTDMIRALVDMGVEEPYRIGVVPAPRLFYAHAALARLDALLQERRDRASSMQPCRGYAGMVPCALSDGHDGPCLTVYPNADRCLYQFTNEGKPHPRCRLQVGHPGKHRPDR